MTTRMKIADNDLFLEITYDRIFQVLKDILQLYSDHAVVLAENGSISRIRDKINYREELNRIGECGFTKETMLQYQQQMTFLLSRLEQIEEEGIGQIENGHMIPVYYLFRLFGLDTFEKLLVLFSFAASYSSDFRRIFALLSDDYDMEYPTPELVIRIFTLDPVERKFWSRHFVERFQGFSLLFTGEFSANRQPGLHLGLQLSERVVPFLWDIGSPNTHLQDFMTICYPKREAQALPIKKDLLVRIDRMCEDLAPKEILFLTGETGSGRKTLLREYCREKRRPIMMIDSARFTAELKTGNMEEYIREIALEALLQGDAFVAFTDFDDSDESFAALESVEWQMEQYFDFFGFTLSEGLDRLSDRLSRTDYKIIQIQLDKNSAAERSVIWEFYLKKWQKELGIDEKELIQYLDIFPARYVLTPGSIKNSVEDAVLQMQGEALDKTDFDMLNEACHRQLGHTLKKDAVKISTIHNFEDLVLPAAQKRLLRDAVNRVRYWTQVFDEWGFHKKIAYGKGTSMIFYGPPGTGKTMGAQVLAKELGLELYKVDMAKVMSKYVGESEKKLGEIFEQGRKSQSILFFDEADVLFGKRSEVKDSQDKYANASTAYLLQKIEEYEGVIILATNLLQNFDVAFMRRFQFVIEFPFPDVDQRLEIWEHVFPKQLPVEDLDYVFLASQFKLTGSQIKNIALAAAFCAAPEKRAVEMTDIFKAMKRENSKIGKNMIASDFGGYYDLVEDID